MSGPSYRRANVRPLRPRDTIFLLGTSSIALLAVLLSLSSAVESASARNSARAASSLNVTDTAHLHYQGSSGSLLIEEGIATGGFPGTVKVHFNVGPTVTASFTIFGHSGAVVGHGSGVLHSSTRYASFGGTMTVVRGTGRYVHAYGHGGFYGVIDRSNYALTVQTTGSLSY